MKIHHPLALQNPCYSVFRRDRLRGKGGGVMAYFKDSIQCEQSQWSSGIHLECLSLKVILSPQMMFTIVVLYHPPHTKNEFYNNYEAYLKNVTQRKTFY